MKDQVLKTFHDRTLMSLEPTCYICGRKIQLNIGKLTKSGLILFRLPKDSNIMIYRPGVEIALLCQDCQKLVEDAVMDVVREIAEQARQRWDWIDIVYYPGELRIEKAGTVNGNLRIVYSDEQGKSTDTFASIKALFRVFNIDTALRAVTKPPIRVEIYKRVKVREAINSETGLDEQMTDNIGIGILTDDGRTLYILSYDVVLDKAREKAQQHHETHSTEQATHQEAQTPPQ